MVKVALGVIICAKLKVTVSVYFVTNMLHPKYYLKKNEA